MMGEKLLGTRFGDAERSLREGQSLPDDERGALLSDLRDLIEAYRDGLRDQA